VLVVTVRKALDIAARCDGGPGERVGGEGRQRLDRGLVAPSQAARLAGLLAVE